MLQLFSLRYLTTETGLSANRPIHASRDRCNKKKRGPRPDNPVETRPLPGGKKRSYAFSSADGYLSFFTTSNDLANVLSPNTMSSCFSPAPGVEQLLAVPSSSQGGNNCHCFTSMQNVPTNGLPSWLAGYHERGAFCSREQSVRWAAMPVVPTTAGSVIGAFPAIA
jgi:hypothetical protein